MSGFPAILSEYWNGVGRIFQNFNQWVGLGLREGRSPPRVNSDAEDPESPLRALRCGTGSGLLAGCEFPHPPGVTSAETVAGTASVRWPSQIKFIISNEACERFSFYGMKGILAGYTPGGGPRAQGQSKDRATEWDPPVHHGELLHAALGGYPADRVGDAIAPFFGFRSCTCVGHGCWR